ncbi:hypothetical protein [Actinophytocola sp.]|jgi:hypothetical protein|uniref:hypothetical protein n=1 Tax=Actinophytocola sp. TaxID=1872138 RepID=UPI002EDB7FB0
MADTDSAATAIRHAAHEGWFTITEAEVLIERLRAGTAAGTTSDAANVLPAEPDPAEAPVVPARRAVDEAL